MQDSVVGMIGLGIMGSAMSANLMRAGYGVVGYDVLESRRRSHRQAGGEVARNCRDVGRRAGIVICSLPSSEALRQTAVELAEASTRSRRALRRDPQRGVRAEAAPIVIETSTLPIAIKREARRILGARGTILLDCPLSGTGAQARAKDLVVYASGDRGAYRRAVPVMEGFARAHYFVGAFGAGSKTKFVANLLVAIHNVAAAEALVLAMKAGLDPAIVLKVVADGAGSSRMLQMRGPMMVKGDYSEATMKLEIWQKDMTIIADFAREVGCPTPLFAASAPLYTAALAMGRQGEDTAAVCAVLEKMAGARSRAERRETFRQHRARRPREAR
jgi:3-hydroxyisobutyrate dehydrogenase-like beta-hydroxyacid dehydrogenase